MVYQRLNEELIKFVKYVSREQIQSNDHFKRGKNIEQHEDLLVQSAEINDVRKNLKANSKN